jgi:formate-nitrite transporter family protein
MRSETDSPRLTMPVSEARDHIQGPESAAVTLVEYGDFECPHCGRAHPILQELMEQLEDQVRLVFRHFPLTQMHPHAQRAAEAAEAAATQKQFWPMHDMLFENQDAMEDEDLVSYAEQLELDAEKFTRELTQDAHIARVREDISSGVRSGVNGTPTFFINGKRHDGPWDLDSLLAAIEPLVAQSHGRGRR